MAQRKTRRTEPTLLDEPRVRFNSGFWDGLAGCWAGGSNRSGLQLAEHFDRAYAAGAQAGDAARRAGEQPETSDEAWLFYRLV
jgi:hypothetical protein